MSSPKTISTTAASSSFHVRACVTTAVLDAEFGAGSLLPRRNPSNTEASQPDIACQCCESAGLQCALPTYHMFVYISQEATAW